MALARRVAASQHAVIVNGTRILTPARPPGGQNSRAVDSDIDPLDRPAELNTKSMTPRATKTNAQELSAELSMAATPNGNRIAHSSGLSWATFQRERFGGPLTLGFVAAVVRGCALIRGREWPGRMCGR